MGECVVGELCELVAAKSENLEVFKTAESRRGNSLKAVSCQIKGSQISTVPENSTQRSRDVHVEHNFNREKVCAPLEGVKGNSSGCRVPKAQSV